LTRWQAILFWAILLLVAFLVEYWRRKQRSALSRLFYRVFGPLLRHQEKKKLAGVTYLFMGGLLVFALFPKEIAALSVLYLAVGDGMATIVGLSFGKHSIGKKTFEGTIAFIISSFLVSFVVPSVSIWIRGVGAVFAGILEAIRLPENDNFWIPFGAGVFMWFFKVVF